MINSDNYKAFVSMAEVGEYRNDIGILFAIVTSGLIMITLIIDINQFSVSVAIVLLFLAFTFVSLLIKKDRNKLLLYESIQGTSLVIALFALPINLLHGKEYFRIVIILMLLQLVFSISISTLLIINRLKTNYYKHNRRKATDVSCISIIGVISGVLTKVAADVVSHNMMVIILILFVAANIFAYMCVESFLRYIIVQTQGLTDIVIIKTNHEQRL